MLRDEHLVAFVGLVHVEEGLKAEELAHTSQALLGHCDGLLLALVFFTAAFAAPCAALATLDAEFPPLILRKGYESLPPFHLSLFL